MTKRSENAIPSAREIDRLRQSIHLLIRVLLVAGRAGAPAEGKIPFNPLYFHILGVLLEKETMRPSELAKLLGVPKSTLSTASKALQSRGLLEQSADPEDGRAQILSLSHDGKDVANAIRRQDGKNMKLMLEIIEPKRRATVIDALEEISMTLTRDSFE